MALNGKALTMLQDRAGTGLKYDAHDDASIESFLAAIPASRLPAHALISLDKTQRFTVALGESYPDWLRRRTGAVPPVPDGVAYPESSEQVRTLIDLARPTTGL